MCRSIWRLAVTSILAFTRLFVIIMINILFFWEIYLKLPLISKNIWPRLQTRERFWHADVTVLREKSCTSTPLFTTNPTRICLVLSQGLCGGLSHGTSCRYCVFHLFSVTGLVTSARIQYSKGLVFSYSRCHKEITTTIWSVPTASKLKMDLSHNSEPPYLKYISDYGILAMNQTLSHILQA
jgi:hypothetical protein